MHKVFPSKLKELLVKGLLTAWAEALIFLNGCGQTTPASWLTLLSREDHADNTVTGQNTSIQLQEIRVAYCMWEQKSICTAMCY